MSTSDSSKTDRNNRFTEAELVCEYLSQSMVAANAWENCYPFHDESSPRWPEYVQASERAETLQRFALLDSI